MEDAHEALRRLKPTPDKLKGLRGTNQDIYDQLILGTTITKAIEGDSKSYSFRYVDWQNPENNVYHVTAEFSVERTRSHETARPDIVLFVNGIPFAVIECKSPKLEVAQAVSQMIRNQRDEYIPALFTYVQLVVGTNKNHCKCATVGTAAKYWAVWREEPEEKDSSSSQKPNSLLDQMTISEPRRERCIAQVEAALR